MTKAKWVEGYLLTVPTKHTAAYKKIAKEAAQTWMKFGALNYKECMAQELKKPGSMASLTFPKLLNQKKGESIWFSYVEYKSRAHRDQVNKKVMAYFSKKYTDQNMPALFKEIRMAMGGFSVEVSG